MVRKRRTFTTEFKLEAAQLARSGRIVDTIYFSPDGRIENMSGTIFTGA